MIRAATSRQNARLRMEVWLWRHGTIWPAVALTCLLAAGAALANGFLLQPEQQVLRQQRDELRASLQSARQAASEMAALPPGKQVPPQEQLQAILYERQQVPDIIRAVHDTARHHEVIVPSADYQLKGQGRHGLLQQTVTLPFQAGYARFKPFLFDLLRTQPGLSIDQISIKRDAVAQSAPEILLRISLWVDPSETPGTAAARSDVPSSNPSSPRP